MPSRKQLQQPNTHITLYAIPARNQGKLAQRNFGGAPHQAVLSLIAFSRLESREGATAHLLLIYLKHSSIKFTTGFSD
jgi:hypothetical protein